MSTNQIAVKAWEKIANYFGLSATPLECEGAIRIIQSAVLSQQDDAKRLEAALEALRRIQNAGMLFPAQLKSIAANALQADAAMKRKEP